MPTLSVPCPPTTDYGQHAEGHPRWMSSGSPCILLNSKLFDCRMQVFRSCCRGQLRALQALPICKPGGLVVPGGPPVPPRGCMHRSPEPWPTRAGRPKTSVDRNNHAPTAPCTQLPANELFAPWPTPPSHSTACESAECCGLCALQAKEGLGE